MDFKIKNVIFAVDCFFAICWYTLQEFNDIYYQHYMDFNADIRQLNIEQFGEIQIIVFLCSVKR